MREMAFEKMKIVVDVSASGDPAEASIPANSGSIRKPGSTASPNVQPMYRIKLS